MTSTTLLLWATASVLVAVATVGALLPAARGWHRRGVVGLVVLALAGLTTAAVVTWSDASISEDELLEAAERAAWSVDGVAGQVSQRRLMAVVSREVGTAVFADPVGRTATEAVYAVRPEGADSPVVCVTVSVSEGTATSVQSSSVSVSAASCR